MHETIKKVGDDYEAMKYNTAIAAIMELSNAAGEYLRAFSPEDRAACEDHRALDAEVAEVLVKLVAPFTPHLADELWREALGREGFVYDQPWPEYDESKTVASSVEMAVQVSGKFKGTIIVPVDSDQDTVVEAAKASEKVAKAIAGMQIVKVIHVKNKLVNLIVKPC